METPTTEPILICVDRDGTLNLDKNYFLGSVPHWKEQLEFLPGVVRGIKLLNKIQNAKIVITTNQAGVALSGSDKVTGAEYDFLTEDRAREVNEHVIASLGLLGCRVDGYRLCPYVSSEYARKAAERGRTVNPDYINDDAQCLKPNIGLLEDAAALFGTTLGAIKHKFMVGDRSTDVEAGLRGGCVSLFIESEKSHQYPDYDIVTKLKASQPRGRVFICKDLYEAAEDIVRSL